MQLYTFTLEYGMNGGSFQAAYIYTYEGHARLIAENMITDIHTQNIQFTENGYQPFMGIKSYSIQSKNVTELTSEEVSIAIQILASVQGAEYVLDELLKQL